MMELEGITKYYDASPAIVDATIRIHRDEYLTLLGPSGSGKSTLLRVIAGLDWPDKGSITLDGEDLTYRPAHLRGLGIVQQNYALFPHMSVRENVSFGLRFREENPVTDTGELNRRVGAMLELVGLTGLENRMVNQISGGQKQRVSLARTLVTEPRLCLLDEPLGALDANLRERMTVELRAIRETLGVTFLHVTGNEAEALAMGDRMIVLDSGRIIMVDDPETVFSRPATVKVARFLNAYNVLQGSTVGGAFKVGNASLPLPAGSGSAAYYAVGFDAAAIARQGDTVTDPAQMEATFITSEFMGSKVLYVLEGPDGVFEVERHLSRADPEVYAQGEPLIVHWRTEDALLFDAAEQRIAVNALAGAA